jgi:hypothetical protein
LRHLARDAGLVKQLHGKGADQRGLLRRFGNDAVARGQRRGVGANDDGDWKIPRADAGEHPTAVKAEFVELARRPRQARRHRELRPRLACVIAQEIDRLAHFEHGIGKRFPGFANAQ